jgi:hypothetical protein
MEVIENKRKELLFFFPLRTNVGYFDTPDGYLSLIERIKQASLLYDRLVFEGGVFEATITEKGITNTWQPPSQVNVQRLRRQWDSFRPTGGNAALYIRLYLD